MATNRRKLCGDEKKGVKVGFAGIFAKYLKQCQFSFRETMCFSFL